METSHKIVLGIAAGILWLAGYCTLNYVHNRPEEYNGKGVAEQRISVYSKPSASSFPVGSLDAADVVDIVERKVGKTERKNRRTIENPDWYKIQFQGREGWVVDEPKREDFDPYFEGEKYFQLITKLGRGTEEFYLETLSAYLRGVPGASEGVSTAALELGRRRSQKAKQLLLEVYERNTESPIVIGALGRIGGKDVIDTLNKGLLRPFGPDGYEEVQVITDAIADAAKQSGHEEYASKLLASLTSFGGTSSKDISCGRRRAAIHSLAKLKTPTSIQFFTEQRGDDCTASFIRIYKGDVLGR